MLRNKLRNSCLFEPHVKIRLRYFCSAQTQSYAICPAHNFKKITINLLPDQTAHSNKGSSKRELFGGVSHLRKMRRIGRRSLSMQSDVESYARRLLLRITEAVPTLSSDSHKSSSSQMCQRRCLVCVVDPSRRLQGRRRRLAYSPA
jgi:hypothetical protein